MQPFIKRIKTNLNGVLQMTQMVDGIMMTGDNLANKIIVELYRDRQQEVIPAGTTIIGYFVRSDGYTLEKYGNVTAEGYAEVTIPANAYYVPGILSIAIRMITGDTKIVIAAASCFVQITETDSIIDPDHKIPDVQELLAHLEELDQHREAIDAEEALRVAAETERVTAENARIVNETARVSSETTRQSNETARVNAESSRAAAENARASAESVRQANETARQSAEAGRVSAETSRVSADQQRQTEHEAAVGEIVNMTVSAVRQDPDTTPLVTISDVSGHKHIAFGIPVGAPFKIKKIFASIAEMEAYSGSDVQPGDFVLICSNTQDPDNAKLYIKIENGYSFIVDLSGSQGFKGETGNGILSVTLNQDYTLTIQYTDGTSVTTGSIRGETGLGVASVVLNADNTLTVTYTDGTSYTSGSLKGDPGLGITSVVLNADNTLTVTYTDGSSYTSGSIKGETGNGIDHAEMEDDYSLTLTYTDGTEFNTGSIRGEKGQKGEPGTGTIDCEYDLQTDQITVRVG